MKRILLSPVTHFNVLLVGTLIIIGVMHNYAHNTMENDNNTRDGAGVLTTYSGTIDRVYVTTSLGVNTFDGGSITIYAEA